MTAWRERMLGRMITTTKQPKWQGALEDIAVSIYRMPREHPNWLPLLTRTSGTHLSAVGFFDRLFGMMPEDGFDLAQILQAYSCVIGFAIDSEWFWRSELRWATARALCWRSGLRFSGNSRHSCQRGAIRTWFQWLVLSINGTLTTCSVSGYARLSVEWRANVRGKRRR